MTELVADQRATPRPAALRGGRSSVVRGAFALDRLAAWGSARWFAPLVGLVSATPVFAAVWRALRWGWVPTGDHATIALRSYDVFSGRSPSLGQATTATEAGAEIAHSPGPMIYWLYSVPSRFGPPWLPAVFAGLVAVACFVGVAVLAQRRGGPLLVLATGLGLCLTVRAVDPWYFATNWNPVAVMGPFILLLFVAWSVGVGERRLFPLAVLLASLAVQSHLTYVFPAIALLAVAVAFGFGPELAGLVRRRRAPGRDSEPAGDDVAADAAAPAPRWRRRPDPASARPVPWLLAGLAVGAACWAAPLYQQLTNRPGNVTLLARSSQKLPPGLGVDDGLWAVGRAVGIPPRFVQPPPFDDPFLFLIRPGTVARISCYLLAAVAVALAVRSAQRRDRTTAVGLALGAALVVAAVTVVASVPEDDTRYLTTTYTLLWFIPAGLFVWLAVGVGVGREVAADLAARLRGAEPRRRPARVATAVAPVAAAAVVVATVAVGVFTVGHDSQRWTYRAADVLGEAAAASVEPGGRYGVTAPVGLDGMFTPVVAYRVRRAGAHPVAAGYGDIFGSAYAPDGTRCDGVFELLGSGPRAEPPPLPTGGRLLVASSIADNDYDLLPVAELRLVPDDGAPSC
ncbi:MAG TPA: hypothetical protein VHK88_01360 [Aquihabitans sp.]|jgi:hypothetical protein|nr:hypothetical protein [Aquihabitans sp.]